MPENTRSFLSKSIGAPSARRSIHFDHLRSRTIPGSIHTCDESRDRPFSSGIAELRESIAGLVRVPELLVSPMLLGGFRTSIERAHLRRRVDCHRDGGLLVLFVLFDRP